jgi:squalene-hopene/tetraprenyl-beta-curcumene cyclase
VKTWLRLFGLAVALGLGVLALPAPAADDKVGADEKEVKELRDKAVAYLKKKQGKDGGFSPKFGPGVTALVVAALSRNGYTSDDPVMKKALEYLTSKVQKDGGIYEKRLANYTTSVGIMALSEANTDGKYDTIVKNAGAYLKKLQNDDVAEKDVRFGGVGYEGKDKRVDMSNTQMFLEALIKAGVPKDDPAVKRALKFITRCQNFSNKEEGNDQAWAAKAKEEDKGGFVYRPDPDDENHSNGEGGLRSLGAMTYGGLKSFLYAGVKKDDPRVQGAVKWIRKHYTLEENPGQKQAGLYYYYHTFGKAMEALGEDNFKDSNGKSHDWRKELFEALKKRQQDDGGFINKGDKTFGESDPSLATAFALLSLSYTTKKK